MVEYVNRRRRKIKTMALEYKGGKCQLCGYDKCRRALGFHHLNPKTKKFTIGTGHSRSWKRVKEELDKCILVCANCHAELEEQIVNYEWYKGRINSKVE